MNTNYSAVVKQDSGWWIGWIEEIPGVNCQEKTRDALIESLRITLREALELNRSDAISAAGIGYEELAIAL
jgi:predicted RNase H-like HicB family nuclease